MNWLCNVLNAITGAADEAWDWINNNGVRGWVVALLIIIIIGAIIASSIFAIFELLLWVQIVMIVLVVTLFALLMYGIATRKSTKF